MPPDREEMPESYRRDTANNVVRTEWPADSRPHVQTHEEAKDNPCRHERADDQRNASMVLIGSDEASRTGVQIRQGGRRWLGHGE